MSGAELDTLMRGIVDLAIVAALWSLLFFKRVKVSSPAAERRSGRAAAKTTADGGAPAPDASQAGSEQPVTPIGRAA
ncbi:MAG TPA: hypothetical protein VKU77_19485 [Streptosporangiaceae bacterium]|nr:hypothetical protein [Streptosporangiaceae bacterium]